MPRPQKTIRKCIQCGETFLAHQSEIRRGGAKFCSSKCWYSYSKSNHIIKPPKKRIKKVCKQCGKEYEVLMCYHKRGNNHTCSKECRDKYLSGNRNPNFRDSKRAVKCIICGKEFTTGAHRLRTGRGKTCSMGCRVKYYLSLPKKFKETSIEIKTEKELQRRGLPYEKQVPIKIASTIVDFLLPNKTIIYCDGDYWHNLPDAKIRGKRQVAQLTKGGYKVFRFWEHEIKADISACIDKVYPPSSR